MLFWLRPCRRGGPPRQVADSVVVTVGTSPSSPVRVGRLWPWEGFTLSKPQFPPSVTQVQQDLPCTVEQLNHRNGAEVLCMINLTGFIALYPV